MKNSVKIAFVAAVAVAGITACTPSQNAAPATSASATPAESSAPGTPTPPIAVVTEVVTSTVTPPAQPQAVARKVDNRPGYGALKLGMTLAEVNAIRQAKLNWSDGAAGCVADNQVAISRKYGVERITLPVEAKTSAGIGIGSTFADVKKAYPAATEYRSGYSVTVQNYNYTFQGDGKIEKIKLAALEVDCAFAHL